MLLLLRALSRLLAVSPEWLLRGIAGALGELVYWCLPRRRRTVLSNLSHAFPDKPHAWLVRTARVSCRRMIETGMFALALPQIRRERIRQIARLDPSVERFAGAIRSEGRPALLGLPHMGAWELTAVMPALVTTPIPPVAAIFRPLKYRKIDDWVRRTRERFGVRLLSRKAGFAEGMDLLRAGGVLCILFDQNARDSGALTLFLERVCSTTTLPGLLVEKFNPLVALLLARRLAFWRYQLEIDADVEAPREAGLLTVHLNERLERLLRSDEALASTWLWLHNRWKTQVEPSRRFRIEHKRSLLPAGGCLPRRTRFFIRLPERFAEVVTVLPLIRLLRSSRPDAALNAIVPADYASLLERLRLFERCVPLPPSLPGRCRTAWRLRRAYPDCWISLQDSAGADIEAFLSRCNQRFGQAGPWLRKLLLTHAWKAPLGAARPAGDRLGLWEGFFRHFGLEGDLSLEPLDLDGSPGSAVGRAVGRPTVGLISASARPPSAAWSPPNWAALATRLRDALPGVSLLSLPATPTVPARWLPGLEPGAGQGTGPSEALHLLDTARRLHTCDVVVADDHAAMLLANLLGRPVVALVAPDSTAGLIYEAPRACLALSGRHGTTAGSFSEPSPDAVLKAALQLLAR